MMGTAEGVDYDKLMMQLDSTTGDYDDAGAQTFGHKGATLGYRKIQNLDRDPTFREFMRNPVFEDAARRCYGEGPISAFRVMFFNKPAGRGTHLPWHQDRWQHLDRDPILTVYTAIDPSNEVNGCVQVIPGSHKRGVLNAEHHSAFLTDANIAEHCPEERVVDLELRAGQVALIHNHCIHRSGVNRSKDLARRALSINFCDGATRIVRPELVPLCYPDGADYLPTIFNAHTQRAKIDL